MIIVENIKVVNAMQTKKNVGRYLFSGYVSSSAVQVSEIKRIATTKMSKR